MCKYALDDKDNNSQMIKQKDEAVFYFHDEEEGEEDSSQSSCEDEIDEGMLNLYDIEHNNESILFYLTTIASLLK